MPNPSPDQLKPFAITDILRFDAGEGGLPRAVITHPAADGQMYLHGAHVTHWTPHTPGNTADPVLFMSAASWFDPQQPIRGGVPICFPWFGPKVGDPDAPAHGLARTRAWQVTHTAADDSGVTIEMAAIIEPFRVTCRARFAKTLRITLSVQNNGSQPARFEEALHTYLRVGDVRQIEISGLENAAYIDKMRSGERISASGKPIRFTAETDRVYLDTSGDCLVRDPALRRVLRVASQQARATVVWNPWIDKAARMPDFGDDEWPTMVCVETANVADEAITLAPGETHQMTAEIETEPAADKPG